MPDEFLEKAAVENDPAKRREYFFRFQEVVQAGPPVINLLSYDGCTVSSQTFATTPGLTMV